MSQFDYLNLDGVHYTTPMLEDTYTSAGDYFKYMNLPKYSDDTDLLDINQYRSPHLFQPRDQEEETTQQFQLPEIKSSQSEESSSSSSKPSTPLSTDRKSFITTMREAYQRGLQRAGLDPKYADDLVAQDALETGWGARLSGKNNFGGIKGQGTTARTKEYINGKMVSTTASFRDFDSIDDYVDAKINLLRSNRYQAFNGQSFIDRVVQGGYATDPQYKTKFNSVKARVRSAKLGMVLDKLPKENLAYHPNPDFVKPLNKDTFEALASKIPNWEKLPFNKRDVALNLMQQFGDGVFLKNPRLLSGLQNDKGVFIYELMKDPTPEKFRLAKYFMYNEIND